MHKTGLRAALTAAACAALVCPALAQAGDADDRAAIVNAMMFYGEVHDFGTPEEYAAQFTDDGEIAVGGQVLVKGHDKLVAQAARDHQKYTITLPNGQTTSLMRHLISNASIEMLDGDHARGTSYVTTMIRDGEEGPKILSVGRYLDTFERRGDRWKIARRTIAMDFGNTELGRKYGFGK
jgi:SnoaL-like protein